MTRLSSGGGSIYFREGVTYSREGVTVARVVWRDGDGNEHERQTSEEVKALILLACITRHPRMRLVLFETR